jgi:hypothetical protein
MASCTRVQSPRAAWPSTETMTSPARMPAAAAGVGGSAGVQARSGCASCAESTHRDTTDTRGVVCGRPVVVRKTPRNRVARTRFISGPPSMITSRLGTASR